MKDCDIDDDLYDALVKSGKYSDDEDKNVTGAATAAAAVPPSAVEAISFL